MSCNQQIYSNIAIESRNILVLQESQEILEESQKVLQGTRKARSEIRDILRTIPENGTEALPRTHECYAENMLDNGQFTEMLSRASPVTPGHRLDFNKTYERLESLLKDIKNDLTQLVNNDNDNKTTIPDISEVSLDWAFQRYKRALEKAIEKLSFWKASHKENNKGKERNFDVEEKLKSLFDTSKMISKVINVSKGLHEQKEKKLPSDDKHLMSQHLNYEILIEKFLTDSESLYFSLAKDNS